MKRTDSENEFLKKLGERLRSLRKEKGYSNYEVFANEQGINRVQYGRYENGEDMRVSTLSKLIQAFDMTPEEFFGDGFENIHASKK